MIIIQQACLQNNFAYSVNYSNENNFNENLNNLQFNKNLTNVLQVIKDMINKFMIRDTHGPMQ